MEELQALCLGGICLPFSVRFREALEYLPAEPCNCRTEQIEPIRVFPGDWELFSKFGIPEDGKGEANILTAYFSDALLPFQRVAFHAVAVRWRDRAYLISAPSGVGKTTQARNLSMLRPGEFSIICGDRPILQRCPLPEGAEQGKEQIFVHPSPWNGKENWHDAEGAPLAGVILLDRGPENQLASLTPREAAARAFSQFIHSGKDEQTVRLLAQMAEAMLQAAPIWRLTSDQVPDSTKLLLQTVFPEDETQ